MTKRDFIVKAVGLGILAASLSIGLAHATNEGNGLGNGGPEAGGPTQGPAGPQGLPGVNGQDGKAGSDGKNGKAGANGSDASVDHSAKMALDVAVRLYDAKYVQVQAFNTYVWDRHNAHDIFEEADRSSNFMFGARIVFKLGKSYEERRLDKQAIRLMELETELGRVRRSIEQ